MHFVILTLILATTLSEYLEKIGFPRGTAYLQELLSGVVLLYVVAMGVRDRFRYLRTPYMLLFGFIVVVMICGVVANSVAPGTVFAGSRNYLRAIPLFFLGAVCAFTDTQLRRQMQLLLLLCLLQLPLAVMQRMRTAAKHGFSGDETSGTLLLSSILSIFLICAACVLTGLYLRKRIRLTVYLPLVLLILLPTTINETKGTLFLLPIGMVITFILGSPRQTRIRNSIIVVSVLAVFGSIFVATYDYVQRERPNQKKLMDFFSEGLAQKYLVKKASGLGADPKEVGRINAIVITSEYLARDPVKLTLGVGMGNASKSSLGPQFQGQYRELFAPYAFLSVVRMGVEIGALGLLAVFGLMYLVFKDTKYVADHDRGLMGAIAVGWMGVVAVMFIGLFYKDLLLAAALPFLFWYFSGLIVARRARIAWGAA